MKIIGEEEKGRLSPEDDGTEALIEELRGFSRVVRCLSEARVPLIGHNCFGDLIRIYGQFIGDLPESYETFKKELHQSFPVIYDTKHVSFHMGRELEQRHPSLADCLTSTNLGELYERLQDRKPQHRRMNSKRVDDGLFENVIPVETFLRLSWAEGSSEEEGIASDDGPKDKDKFHEAGFDSYATAFCFIRIAHMSHVLRKSM